MWHSWAEEHNINPKLEENSSEELDKILQRFYAEVRNKHGEQYELESLKVMMARLDRYLLEHNYPNSIIKDRQFQQSKQVLEGKAKLFGEDGKGKRPNASKALTIPEEEALRENEKLRSSSPKVLCQTMWWILTQHFGLRGRQEHHSMAVEDFSVCSDDDGVEYVTFKENPTKTRQGGLNTKRRPVLPKMFATGGARCPVGLFKEFLSRRPPELRETGPFYLAAIEKPKTAVWYKKQRLGVHSIGQMMKSIVTNTAVTSTGKKLTNHSARKTLVKKLRAANVERQSIIQITGHASEQSLQDYDEGSEQEQKVLSSIFSNKQQLSFQSNRDQGPQVLRSAFIFSRRMGIKSPYTLRAEVLRSS